MKSSLLGDWVIELYKQFLQVVLEAVWFLGARLASLCVINQYRELKVVIFPSLAYGVATFGNYA